MPENVDRLKRGLGKIKDVFTESPDSPTSPLHDLLSSTGPDWLGYGGHGGELQKQLADWIAANKDKYDKAIASEPKPQSDQQSAATPAAGSTSTPAAQPGQSTQFVNPLAMQMFFASTIAPMLQQIQGSQQQAIDQFKQGARGQVDPRQLASMQNVLNANAAATVAAPAVDQLMSQVNNVLNAQNKAYYEAMRANAVGGTDTTALLQALGIKPAGQ